MSKFTQQNHENWDQQLQEIVYGYNSAMQESSRYTPFEAMYGRLAKLPVDFNASKNYDADEKLKEFVGSEDPLEFERVAKRRKTETKIKVNIKKAQRKQKAYYDRKHCSTSHFTTGDTVLKKDFRRKKRKGGKLDYRWMGPYVIANSLGKGLFRLKEIGSKKIKFTTSQYRFKTPGSQSNRIAYQINIINVNDNPPVFSAHAYFGETYGRARVDNYVLHTELRVTDADYVNDEQTLTFRIVSANQAQQIEDYRFQVDVRPPYR